jgi:hypothetical protein
MLLPANVSTGRVVGQFIVGVIDGDDPDEEPEVVPASGTITFSASVPYLPNLGSVPNPKTILTKNIVGVLDSQGYLSTPKPGTRDAAYPGVRLVANDDPDLSVESWTWSVIYKFDSVDGTTPNIPPHSFVMLSDETVDLTTVIKVPSSTGLGTLQAEALVAASAADAAEASDAAQSAANSAQSAADSAAEAANTVGAANSLIDARIDTKLVRTLLEDGTDLNAMNTTAHVGTYAVGGTLLNGPSVNLPSTGTLEIGKGSDFGVYQRITAGVTMWFREVISVSAGTWFEWTQTSTLDTNGKVPVVQLPAGTTSVAGTMSAEDKTKLDAATAANTDGTLVLRYNGGETNFKGVYLSDAPSSISHATRKDYVDALVSGQVRTAASKPATDLPSTYAAGVTYSQATADGTWPVTAANVITIRHGSSRTFQMVVGKVTGTTWVRSEDTDTWGVFTQLATTAVATGSLAGLMSAADKALLDTATSATTASALVKRSSTGDINVNTPTSGGHPTTKNYVDAMVWDGSDITTGTISDARIAKVTSVLDGLMLKADKIKLDAATSSATGSTLVLRAADGRFNTPDPTSGPNAATKDYVDAMVWDGSDITTGTISDARIAKATSLLDGLMLKADKAKLDAATGGATGSTLALRYSDGRLGVATPTATGDATTKAYVDGKVWDGADITTGTVSASRLPVATGSVPGTMSAADKAKFDAATSAPTVSTIAMRNSAGRIQVTDPASDTTAATPKSYVDGQISPLPLGLVGYTNAVSVTGAQNTTEVMLLEKTISVVSGRNYDIRVDLDFYGETAGDIALTVNVIYGGTGATGTIIDTKIVWGSPVAAVGGTASAQMVIKYTATSTASLRFAYTTNRASGSGNYRVNNRKLAILDTGSAI